MEVVVNTKSIEHKYTSDGCIMMYCDNKGYIPEQEYVMEKQLERMLTEEECIHHIDGNRTNNDVNNLLLCTDAQHHKNVHSQLAEISLKLVEKDIICFDRSLGKYYLNPNYAASYFPESLGFDDVAIKCRKNICLSRSDVNVSSEVIKGITRSVPLIASNMSTVTSPEFCIKLYELGALGCLHRAMPDDEIIQGVKKISRCCSIVCASVGVGEDQFELACKIIKSGVNVLFIDIAHGYSDTVVDIARKIKTTFSDVKVVVGNTVNERMLLEVAPFADAVKVGIAQGLACETKDTAGCTEKQITAILKFKKISKDFGVPIISDGGIRKPSDFVKAIGAGASSVMAGSIFAACPESAAEEVQVEGSIYKIYAGMASRYVQTRWKGGLKPGTCPEGKVVKLPLGESCTNLISRYIGALRSGVTYSGVQTVRDFQNECSFIKLSRS